ncbi:hypothetical protein HOY80DRAFT_982638 [Tuber brumale]|nr:hypothetical protein HOY80DRAFT_982638 [Tuber brumale]
MTNWEKGNYINYKCVFFSFSLSLFPLPHPLAADRGHFPHLQFLFGIMNIAVGCWGLWGLGGMSSHAKVLC